MAVYDAKALFSEFPDAVLISIDEWKRLKNQAKHSLPDTNAMPDGCHSQREGF